MNKNLYILVLMVVVFVSCSKSGTIPEQNTPGAGNEEEGTEVDPISEEELLNLVQKETFKYFWDFAQTNSGAARERYHPDNPLHGQNTVAVGGTGFGLMSILVGIERGFISRQEGVSRLEKILGFLESADRFHGAWPHWLDGTTGEVKPFSTNDNGGDLVETAFLTQGLICIKEYFKNGTAEEIELSNKANVLWKGVEWNWYTQEQDALYWHWSPDYGFEKKLQLKGYNETLIAYVLAAASPDYSIEKSVYTNGWASDGRIISPIVKYGYPLLLKHGSSQEYGGPLFWAHYSYLGLNPKNLSDNYANFWDVNVSHSKINYQYCVENPLGYRDYSDECWGLTASYTRNNDGSMGYSAHSPTNDRGVISPTAAISSIPYTPEKSLKAMRFFYRIKDKLLGPAGFYDAFSPQNNYWVARAYLAIDQGPQIIMIENYRSGLLWNLFMQNEDVQKGLKKLGFQ